MIRIDYEKCDECGTCISVCPEDALVLESRLSVHESRCVRCGRCVKVCPFGALSFQKRDGGEGA